VNFCANQAPPEPGHDDSEPFTTGCRRCKIVAYFAERNRYKTELQYFESLGISAE